MSAHLPIFILEQRREKLLSDLLAESTTERRLERLMDAARSRKPAEPGLRVEANEVPGCMSKVWLRSTWRAGRCWFEWEAESLVVASITGLLSDLYSGARPAEILACDPGFLRKAGITAHLTANRRNALSRIGSRIRDFAASCRDRQFYDAHNHLQDDRFAGRQDELVAAAVDVGVGSMVVNGSCESDWPAVAELARRYPGIVIPSFGYHPWYIHERTERWIDTLKRLLDENPNAVIGEIGLDRWKPGLSYDGQEQVFHTQLSLAAERNLPVSVHCLQAWGRMLEILTDSPRPPRGVVLHSYGGSTELVKPLAELGACFSFPGYFAHERKDRQRETFRHVPEDRILIETDAPDQLPPAALITHPLAESLNHPANLAAIYGSAAVTVGKSIESLAARVADNFRRVFEAAPAQSVR